MIDMMELDITIKRGDTYEHTFLWVDPDTGERLPLTGWTARLQGRKKLTSSDTIFDFSSAADIELIVDEQLNEIRFKLEHETTKAYALLEDGLFDLEVTEIASGYVETIIGGALIIEGDITRGYDDNP